MRPRAAAIVLAVALDLVGGEPSDLWHPVAWVGRALGWAEHGVRGREVAHGAVALAGVGALVTAAACLVAAAARRLGVLGVLVEAVALKASLSIRRLGGAADEVRRALAAGDAEAGRFLLGRHLVSRDPTGLSPAQVASGAVESVAENLTDSVAAPLLFYAAGGLPAAWAYRVVNTADAMWGYRDARHERFGTAAATLDDVANLVPARAAALALVAGAGVAGEDAVAAWRIALRDHDRTASPNAGWPMAAMAGALGVGLEKPGAYRLGSHALPESPETIRRAVRVFAAASLVVVAAAVGLALLREGRR
jgi:adenosylcobinamide-phosphate synthase